MTVVTTLFIILATTFCLTIVFGTVGYLIVRRMMRWMESSMGQPPSQSLWEMLFTLKSHTWSALLLTMQRAETGQPAEHPMGSQPVIDWMSHVGFDPATFAPVPLGRHVSIDLRVSLGPRATRPVTIALPVLIAPMGYGIGLSAETKVALAQAATVAGTAVVSGEGPYLPEERAYAERWILQQSRANWAHQTAVLQLADMIELQWGQGSEGGMEVVKRMPKISRRTIIAAQGPAVIQATPYASLAAWISTVKNIRGDCPIDVKLPASQHLERDLAYLLTLSIDVITLDASGAGSAGSPSVISDHTGISVTLATHRAHQWLVGAGERERITLIVSGGVHGAAEVARLIALGADAVMVGSSVLFAALHEQIASHLPAVPPTALAFARSVQNTAPRLDVNQAAEHITNWFEATRAELETILRALGFSSLAAFRQARPLVARSREAARLFKIPFDGDEVSLMGNLLDSVRDLATSYNTLNHILVEIEEAWQHGHRHTTRT